MALLLNCNGRLLASEQPVVMGIINVTPDSFYTKGRNNTPAGHLEKAEEMLAQGALMLDIGGMSTRPGATVISEQEELERVLPVIEEIKKRFSRAYISVDTYRATVAKAAVEHGADIVNDISAGNLDAAMIPTVAQLNVPYIAMHMQGTPADMQKNPVYENTALEILNYCATKLAECKNAGIKDVILDPGFGFGKTLAHNYQLLKGLHTFRILEAPLLVGLSRKSMVYKLLGTNAESALNATTALHILALQQGADILRVHDVKEAVECVKLFAYYQTI